ncbi:MAG: neutral/alkaline non-lysosomal ceramidase N-terminal domain-containing protein, partial [Anaerolineales bacterium]|nr:neutral/alkaline non-lysosomal ceramidase N-terminal domain-containing protein [Anaerolineales bacterium]
MGRLSPLQPATFLGRMGVARADITPPAGIHSRAWGAAAHDTASGIHQPLTTTALAILPDDGPPRLIVGADICWISDVADFVRFREAIAAAAGMPGQIENVLLAVSHTHSAPPLDRSRANAPGGDLLAPYMEAMRDAFAEVTQAAIANAVPAQIVVETGSCHLAVNRDLPYDDADHYACGFHPGAPTDTTLLVGRITERGTGRILGTLVNYACHPTTLAWENTLISPDYVGTMREVVEGMTASAPCLFIQGASGELSARECHQGETAMAEKHGRQLGYAVLSTLEGMLPPDSQLNYMGLKESGARLAYWRYGPLQAHPGQQHLQTETHRFPLPIKPTWPSRAEFQRLHVETTDRVQKEIYFRRIMARHQVGDGDHYAAEYTYWRLGDILL